VGRRIRDLGTSCTQCQILSPKTLGQSILNFDQLKTLFFEIDCILNSLRMILVVLAINCHLPT